MRHLSIPQLTDSDVKRLWASVDVQGDDECWPWLHNTIKGGYGRFVIQDKKYVATRITYYLCHGIDPGEKQVCHSCDNPGCCNPTHLWLGTQAENTQDSFDKGRSKPQKGDKHGQAKLTETDILAIRYSDISVRQLAYLFGMSQESIRQIKVGETWKHVSGPLKGIRQRGSLTFIQAQEIRQLYATGNHTQSQLGNQFGVHRGHISRIVRHEQHQAVA